MTNHTCVFSATDLEAPRVVELSSGEAAVFTHRAPNKSRDNEDSVAVIEVDAKYCVMAVADGLGGLPKGAAASKQVVDGLLSEFKKNKSNIETVKNVINHCNTRLLDQDDGNATTLSLAEIRDNELFTYQVGDSAVWVIGQQGKPKLRTAIHSPVGEALDSGQLSEIDALLHSERNLVSNVIGSTDMYIDVTNEMTLASRDTVLVASDGLFDNLFEDEIIEIVRKGPLLESAQALIEQVGERMNQWPQSGKTPAHPDDLSFILYRPH